MLTTSHPDFLRRVLAGAGVLERLLGLPGALTREAGIVLLPFAILAGLEYAGLRMLTAPQAG